MFSWWNSLDAVSRISTVSNFLIAILGIWVFVVGRRENQLGVKADDKANAIRDAEISKSNERAAEANRLAALANERAESEAKQRAQIELELAIIKTPRTVTKEQRERFISAAKKSTVGPIKVGARNPDIETSNYIEDLIPMLEGAGYTITSSINYPNKLGTLRDNSTIIVVFHSDKSVPPHGRGLLNAFNESGISVALALNEEMVDKYAVEPGEVMVFILEKRYPAAK